MYIVSTESPPIKDIINLRYEVLRKPWNKPIETVTDELEEIAVHAYIIQDNQIIACARLQDNGKGVGQLRYMAVHPNYQGKGLGKLIVAKLEQEAQKLQLHTIELQARENAVNFYKNSGYTVKEKTFNLWDIIQHFLMTKSLK